MREFKVIVYPIFGVLQFFLAAQDNTPTPLAILQIICGFMLIGLGVLNLKRLLQKPARRN